MFNSIRKQVSSWKKGKKFKIMAEGRKLHWPEKCPERPEPAEGVQLVRVNLRRSSWGTPPPPAVLERTVDSSLSSWGRVPPNSTLSSWELFPYRSRRREEMKGWSARSSWIYMKNIMTNSCSLSCDTGEQCQTWKEAENFQRFSEKR